MTTLVMEESGSRVPRGEPLFGGEEQRCCVNDLKGNPMLELPCCCLPLPLGPCFSVFACLVVLVAVVVEQESSMDSTGWFVYLDSVSRA